MDKWEEKWNALRREEMKIQEKMETNDKAKFHLQELDDSAENYTHWFQNVTYNQTNEFIQGSEYLYIFEDNNLLLQHEGRARQEMLSEEIDRLRKVSRDLEDDLDEIYYQRQRLGNEEAEEREKERKRTLWD